MRKRPLRTCFILILVFLLSLPIAGQASVTTPQSWYCVRNREHKQPVLDANLRVIEKYGGYYVDKDHGDSCPDKVVYLTFDAGYENGNVAKILDALKREDVKGAFFILENLILRNPELVMRMRDEGHIIGNHTASHKNMTKIHSREEFRQELEKLEQIYAEKIGGSMSKYYRPPEGAFTEENLAFASALGYKTIFWSFAYADWDNGKQPPASEAMAKILDHVHNGAVLLLHPTSATNAEILGDVIAQLKRDGYRFGTLDELTGTEAVHGA